MSCVGGFAQSLEETNKPIEEPSTKLIVLGAPGEAEYGALFQTWGNRWREVFGESECVWVDGTNGEEEQNPSSIDDKTRILDFLSKRSQSLEGQSDAPKWLVLIGHGTYDASGTKFNLRGPDISADEIAKALEGDASRWIIVNCASSSGPFHVSLSRANRVVITATKSGAEQNFARFGGYLSLAISDPASDLDHDSSVSILEAFLAASASVARFYRDEGRLASEQALLDDNGDKKGTPASFFRGLRPAKAPADGLQLDGELAQRVIVQRLGSSPEFSTETIASINGIEDAIAKLRSNKASLASDEYYRELEKLLLQLAERMFEAESTAGKPR
ncbi:hypothetical protein SH467x_002499 [Pirellulaceae bacterium SH467]